MNRFNVSITVAAAAIVAMLLANGCGSGETGKSESAAPQKSNRIIAASYALQYLTSRIAGDQIQVDCPPAEGENPLDWSPNPEQIAAMQKADLIVINGQGAEYAQWITQTTLAPSRICESVEDIPLKDLISVPDYRIVHAHGPEGEHSHPYMVPYTWLDPAMAARQAEKIAECLSRAYPDRRAIFESNLGGLINDLNRVRPQTPASDEPSIMTISLNPYLKYFARAAGLVDEHLLWFDLPKASEWETAKSELAQKISDNDVQFVLASGDLPEFVREYLVEKNLQVIRIDLLDHAPVEGDLITALKNNFDRASR
jgi:zinc transport system substrate-binding protein